MSLLASAAVSDQPVRVTSMEASAQGKGFGSVLEQLLFAPPEPAAEYADSLHAEINTSQGPLMIDASFAISAGTEFDVNITCTDPDTSEPDSITAFSDVELIVLADTTVEIICTSGGGAKDVEWSMTGPVSASIHGAYNGTLELPAGEYDLDAFLDWGSPSPHSLSIITQDPDVLRLSRVNCSVEISATMTANSSDTQSDPNGLPYGVTVTAAETLPDCFVEYHFQSALTWTANIGSPLTIPGFVGSGQASARYCATGGASISANFTLDIPHFVIWQVESQYPEDAPLINSTALCSFPSVVGCMKLTEGSWTLTDGGIYDGSFILFTVGFLPATIRIPEDAPTFEDAITLISQTTDSIESLGPLCNSPVTLDYTIEFAPGTYNGPLNSTGPGVPLTIKARDGLGTVDIVGLSSTRCFDFSDGYTTVNIDGLNLSDGLSENGGAVHVGEGVTVQFTNCSFESNVANASGGAIHLESIGATAASFDTCVFINNQSLGDGGAVTVSGGVEPSFLNCTFDGNEAGNLGGAIAWLPESSQTAQVTDCTIENNLSLVSGAGITHVKATSSVLSIENSLICDNIPMNISGSWDDLGGNTICMPCAGDLNDDGFIDGPDLTLLLSNWGPCPTGKECIADLNKNGSVDGSDLSILLGSWGPCP